MTRCLPTLEVGGEQQEHLPAPGSTQPEGVTCHKVHSPRHVTPCEVPRWVNLVTSQKDAHAYSTIAYRFYYRMTLWVRLVVFTAQSACKLPCQSIFHTKVQFVKTSLTVKPPILISTWLNFDLGNIWSFWYKLGHVNINPVLLALLKRVCGKNDSLTTLGKWNQKVRFGKPCSNMRLCVLCPKSPYPPRSLVRDERTHPHRPRLVVSHSTCPPLSSSPPPRTAL